MANLFNSKLTEEQLFWEQYTTLVREQEFNRKQVETYQRTHNDLPFISGFLRKTHSILTWFFDTRQLIEREEFWKFQLITMKKTALTMSIFNTFVLLLSIIGAINPSSPFLSIDDVRMPLKELLASFCIRLILNSMFLLFFIVVNYFADKSNKFLNVDLTDVWGIITTVILMSKLFTLVNGFVTYLFYKEESRCYGIGDTLSDDAVLFYLFIITLTDMIQAHVYSVYPFRYSSYLLYTIIQFIECSFRFLNCERVVTHFPLRTKIIGLVMLEIIGYFFTMGIMPLATQINLQNTFINLKKQKLIIKDNISFVNLLCQDIKLSTLQHRKVLNQLKVILKPIWWNKITHLYNSVLRLSEIMNIIVDEIVFLVKIEEKRFHFQCSDEIEFTSLFDTIIQMIHTIYQNDSKSEQIHEILSHYFILTIPANQQVQSHLNCLRILLMFSFIATFELLKLEEDGAILDEFIRSHSNSGGALIDVKCVLQHSLKVRKELLFEIRWPFPLKNAAINLSSQDASNSTDFNESQSHFLLKSACVLCDKISRTFAGNWTITATGIEFTCPYEPIQTENVGIFHSDDEEENNRLINFISNECGLIITDSKVEGLVIDAIYQLPGGKEIEIIKDFQNLHIIPHTVLFIQTYTVIERLQQLGFKGKVILLSERLAYLGEEVRTHITYSSQLPWSEESIYNLRNYLFNVMLEKYLPPEQHHHSNPTPHQREVIDATSGKSTGSILHQVENRSISSILMDILRQHTTLIYDNSSRAERIDNLNESYYKWKYLHPLRGWFSRAIVMDLTVFINFVLLLALYVLGDVSLNYVLAEFVSILLVVLRTLLYNKMKNNITFHSIWKGFVWVNALGLIWMMFLDFFRFSENGLIFVPSLHFDSFIDFLQTTVGQLNGLGTLSFIMRSTSFIRYYGEAVPRPFTLWCVLFIGIKQWLILAYFFYSQYLPVAVLSIIGLCFILTLIIWMIYQINAVESVETEFLQLYDRIIANDTFQRCTQLSKLFLIPRLQQLDQIETNILDRLYLHSTVLHGKHFLSRRLKKKGGEKDMKSIDDKANYFNDEDDDDEDEEDDESVATFDGTIDKRRGEGVGLGEEINYELPKYLQLPPELIEILLNLQHHKRMTQILCYSLQPLMEDRIVIIPPNSTSNHLSTSPSTMKEKYDAIKKTILVKFKATLIRIIVQDLIQSYIHGGYSTSIKYYLFIHPSIAIVRIDKMLLVTTLSDMIQQSIQRIENRSKSSMSRQNNKMMMSSSMDENSIDHQLLIWIQPTSTGDIILPYSQIRQLQITVLDTGFFTPEHYTLAYDNSRLAASMTFFKPPLPPKSSEKGSKETFEPSSFAFIPQCSEVLKSGYHRLSDQFLEFFDLPHRSEMGILHHCQYHYYQKTALPILLTTRTNEMEKILKNRSNAHTYHGGPNEIVKINALHPRVYSQCSVELEQTRFAHLTQELQEVASLLAPKSDTNEGGVGSSSAGGGSNNNRHQSITMVTASSSLLSEATKKKLLDYKERLIQAEKKSKRNIETVLQVLSSMILKIPLDVQQLSRAKQTSASSVTASLESHPGWLRNPKSQSLLTTPSFSLYNSSKTNNPHRKGIVTMFCVNGEETSAKNSIIQYMFKSRYWGCQTHYLEGFPKKKSFQDSDIIIIEYSPRYVRHRDDRFPFSPGEQKEKDKEKERDRDKKYGKKKGKKYRGSGGGGGGGAFSDNESTNNDDFDYYDEYESYHPFKYYYCLEMPYNIPQLIHYIRLQGFTGLIVIVYQSAQKRQTIEHLSRQLEYPIEPNPDIDERTVHSLQNPNDYTDAVSANLHITLPWKEETVDNILTEWKKKMIERIFNSNKECADNCK